MIEVNKFDAIACWLGAPLVAVAALRGRSLTTAEVVVLFVATMLATPMPLMLCVMPMPPWLGTPRVSMQPACIGRPA